VHYMTVAYHICLYDDCRVAVCFPIVSSKNFSLMIHNLGPEGLHLHCCNIISHSDLRWSRGHLDLQDVLSTNSSVSETSGKVGFGKQG
jgi:hypothetical protein